MSEDRGQIRQKNGSQNGEDAEIGIIRCQIGDLRLPYRRSKPRALPLLPATRNP